MSENLKKMGFLLENLMNNMTDMIYFKDLDSRFVLMNKAAAVWQGYNSPEETIGKTDFDHYEFEDAQKMLEAERHIIETGEPLEGIEEEETRKDGKVGWVFTTKMPLRDDEGNIIGTFGVSRDITEHKEAELRAAYYAEKVQAIKDEMEDDVRMAAELQKTFFPHGYPSFPAHAPEEESCVRFFHHYQASEMVSGDFCAVRRLSETESGIFLCDVMGHGVRAALGTALIYAMVEEVLSLEKDPGKVLDRMNTLLLPILHHQDVFLYATSCYMVFDAATGLLRVANAGHPDPLHLKPAQGRVDWLVNDDLYRGPALAILEDPAYQTKEVQIQPGDSVMMYTDGLYELSGPDEEEYGEERVLASANRHVNESLKELSASLISDANAFSKKESFDDDLCLIGFTFSNPL